MGTTSARKVPSNSPQHRLARFKKVYSHTLVSIVVVHDLCVRLIRLSTYGIGYRQLRKRIPPLSRPSEHAYKGSRRCSTMTREPRRLIYAFRSRHLSKSISQSRVSVFHSRMKTLSARPCRGSARWSITTRKTCSGMSASPSS